MVFISLCHVFGRLVLRRTGRALPQEDVASRLQRLSVRCTLASLHVLFIMYPVVSRTAISIFSCRRVGESYFLIDDPSIQCYTPSHLRMKSLGAFWVCVFPVGVPLYFAYLLYRSGVPAMAKRHINDAWLLEVARMAAQDGLALECARTGRFGSDEMSEADLVLLHSTYVSETEAAEAEDCGGSVQPGGHAGVTDSAKGVSVSAHSIAALGPGGGGGGDQAAIPEEGWDAETGGGGGGGAASGGSAGATPTRHAGLLRQSFVGAALGGSGALPQMKSSGSSGIFDAWQALAAGGGGSAAGRSSSSAIRVSVQGPGGRGRPSVAAGVAQQPPQQQPAKSAAAAVRIVLAAAATFGRPRRRRKVRSERSEMIKSLIAWAKASHELVRCPCWCWFRGAVVLLRAFPLRAAFPPLRLSDLLSSMKVPPHTKLKRVSADCLQMIPDTNFGDMHSHVDKEAMDTVGFLVREP